MSDARTKRNRNHHSFERPGVFLITQNIAPSMTKEPLVRSLSVFAPDLDVCMSFGFQNYIQK